MKAGEPVEAPSSAPRRASRPHSTTSNVAWTHPYPLGFLGRFQIV